jgi:hypothetical protein
VTHLQETFQTVEPSLDFRGTSEHFCSQQQRAMQNDFVGGALRLASLELAAGVPHQVEEPEFPPITFTFLYNQHRRSIFQSQYF